MSRLRVISEMQQVKSPLRYPGSKSKAIAQIAAYFPPAFDEFREPFVGGGSVFIYVRQKYPAVRVWINDLNPEVFAFWISARDELEAMVSEVERVKKTRTDGRALFQDLTTVDVGTLTLLERGVRFFVLNRISFSGTVEAGGYSEKAFHARFTFSSIERLQDLKAVMTGVKITNSDYRDVIHVPGRDLFIFLDPPYFAATDSRLYGRNGILHTGFNHSEFAAEMRRCRHKWLITYDDSETVRLNFAFARKSKWQLQYGMNNYKQDSAGIGNELFISNYGLSEKQLGMAF